MTLRRLLAPLAALCVLGCIQPPVPPRPKPTILPQVRTFRSGGLARAGRLRALILPFAHGDRTVSRAVRDAFAIELAKSHRFEVLPLSGPEAELVERLPVWDGGSLDVHSLSVLRRRLNVDAIVVGKILSHRPYSPPVLGLRAQIVSTRTGAVLWGAEATFDGADAGTQYLMEQFHGFWLDDSPRRMGWKVLLNSPRQFNQFVAHQLIATIQPTTLPEPPTLANHPG